jgi:Flp pilus assembly protein TadG
MSILSKIKNQTQSFSSNTKGVAAIEFAALLPLMLAIFLISVEASRAISYHNRVISIASAIGDLVAQSQEDIEESDLENYFTAAQTIIAPYPKSGIKQILTSVYVDDKGIARVTWSYGFTGELNYTVAYPKNSQITIPEKIKNISKESFIIISEASVDYQPLVRHIPFVENVLPNIPFDQKFYHLPRSGGEIKVN